MAKKPAVVVIEDNPGDVLLIREALTAAALDCDVEVLKDGAEATDYAERWTAGPGRLPALFVLDVNLPKETGWEVILRLKEHPQLRAVPVLMMSSSLQRADRERALRLGADVFFSKPLTYDQFLQVGPLIKDLIVRDKGLHADIGSHVSGRVRPAGTSGPLGQHLLQFS